MDGSLIPDVLEIVMGLLIYRPAKELANSIIRWLRVANLDEETIIDFLKYNFPRIKALLERNKKD